VSRCSPGDKTAPLHCVETYSHPFQRSLFIPTALASITRHTHCRLALPTRCEVAGLAGRVVSTRSAAYPTRVGCHSPTHAAWGLVWAGERVAV
jgi:hypothetical protein